MIKYALQCDQAHAFESWFADSAGFEVQRKRGLVDCPMCGSRKIEKQIMAPSVRLRDGPSLDSSKQPPPAEQTVALMDDGPLAEHARRLRAMLRELHAHVEANTEDVGVKFADEARKIHYGESEERAIRGKASIDEARELHEEGIGVLPLPPLPDERN